MDSSISSLSSIFSLVYPTFCCIVIIYILTKLFQRKPPKFGIYAPSPPKLPIIGHLHLLSGYQDNPWLGFDAIREKYGDVVALKLGFYDAIMVSSLETIREVLLTKGKIFSDRPNFNRYHVVFGGNRENALALCDWSELQRTRRNLCTISTIPKSVSASYGMLDEVINSEMKEFFKFVETSSDHILTKDMIRQFSTNVFTKYLCAKRLDYDDPVLSKFGYFCDFIFADISQCCPVDFIPFIKYFGLYQNYLAEVTGVSNQLREYVEKYYIEPRVAELKKTMQTDEKIDLKSCDSMISLDIMYKYHLSHPEEFSYDTFLFAIGDMVGGASAIVNMVMRLIGHCAIDEKIQEEMYQEVAAVAKQNDTDMITLEHRQQSPLIEAAILEALRISSSPIVPHVPTEDTTIGGYYVPKGTMILFNNYHMNFSEKYYTEPEVFQPRRFLTPSSDNSQSQWQIKKPEVFLPFSVGQRSCLGLKLTQYITFVAISNILLRYKIQPLAPIETIRNQIRIGVLALEVENIFQVKLVPRNAESSKEI